MTPDGILRPAEAMSAPDAATDPKFIDAGR